MRPPEFSRVGAEQCAAVRFQPALKLHQQHLTDRKLPSPWPAGRHSRGYDFGILRHMTAGLAESGE